MELAVRAHAKADPRAVFALLVDGTTWPTWTPIDSFRLERPGRDGGESLGAIRVFRTGRIKSREEIVELVPDRRLGYILLSGLPLKGYRATVDLAPEGDGTAINWRSTFRPKVPGTGWIYRRALTRFIQRCVDGLAEHAAQGERGATASERGVGA